MRMLPSNYSTEFISFATSCNFTYTSPTIYAGLCNIRINSILVIFYQTLISNSFFYRDKYFSFFFFKLCIVFHLSHLLRTCSYLVMNVLWCTIFQFSLNGWISHLYLIYYKKIIFFFNIKIINELLSTWYS